MKVTEREITPRDMYMNRRMFMRGAAVAAGAVATGLVYKKLNGVDLVEANTPEIAGLAKPTDPGYRVNAMDDGMTPFASVTNYNNFYEFTTNKDGVAAASQGFDTKGWKVVVDGLCHAPKTFDLDDLRKLAPREERVYRMRCVEAWSMVVPWAGFSLSKLLDKVQPMADAKYVAFETLVDPAKFPGQKEKVLDWPYREGLRIDEAMHPLALLATGLYGHELPAQDGAPVRMVLPWKYGFKGIKSIVRISLVAQQPPTSWNKYAPKEYGFFANVNPKHPHPRWSQATEQRIGESGRRDTLMFNGYADQVASLYKGMDLDVYF